MSLAEQRVHEVFTVINQIFNFSFGDAPAPTPSKEMGSLIDPK
jgi:hypothetical protein